MGKGAGTYLKLLADVCRIVPEILESIAMFTDAGEAQGSGQGCRDTPKQERKRIVPSSESFEQVHIPCILRPYELTA